MNDIYLKSLKEASRLAITRPAWSEFGKYCDLLLEESEDSALSHLNTFIEETSRWSFNDKREFVSWLYHLEHKTFRFVLTRDRLIRISENTAKFITLIHHNLHQELLSPTVNEWIEREPLNAEAACWRGNITKAIEIAPTTEIYREKWILQLLASTDNLLWSCKIEPYHELKYFLDYLDEAEKHLPIIKDVESHKFFESEIERLRKGVTELFENEAQDNFHSKIIGKLLLSIELSAFLKRKPDITQEKYLELYKNLESLNMELSKLAEFPQKTSPETIQENYLEVFKLAESYLKMIHDERMRISSEDEIASLKKSIITFFEH